MTTRIMTTALALLLFAGCSPDVGEGKAKATIIAPASAASLEVKAAPASQKTIAIDTKRSAIAVVAAKVTLKHDIAFDDWKGTVDVAGADLKAINISIQMASMRADVAKLTGHLKSPDFFDVAKFPTATFSSSSAVAKAGPKGATHVVTGKLTMHGVTKDISFPATVKVAAGTVDMRAEFVIDRKDFGVVYPGMPDDLIHDDVALNITLIGG